MLEHGGQLRIAAKQYDIPLDRWLDLSTGINPMGWPVPPVPAGLWSRLPEDNDGLEQAAREYYNVEQVLPVAGSQAAIQALPLLRSQSRVGILSPAYAEHANAWHRTGHHVTATTEQQLNTAIAHSDVLVLIHPNNPTGARFAPKQLLAWHEQLTARNGWLIVDEAFMDTTPEQSLCPYTDRPGLIVLRSLGKFFGLAGARVGFVCAQQALLSQLHTMIGPWNVNAAGRWLATSALRDRSWQADTRQRLKLHSSRLHGLLTQTALHPQGGCDLFQWVETRYAAALHRDLARQGILTRLFEESSSLRFGIPATEANWQRLEQALAACPTAENLRLIA